MQSKFRVVIVGGGTAGWMTASYLTKALDHGVDITLVESKNIGTVGVGEATFSTIRLFFDFLGLEEEDWMHHCNASYKMAIKFVDWNAQKQTFYHPFQRFEVVDQSTLVEWWLKLERGATPFDYSCFSVPALCDAKRSPRFEDGRVFDRRVQEVLSRRSKDRALLLEEHKVQYPYAYHFDAGLLAEFLSGFAQKRGVSQIVDEVSNVELDADGAIESLVTAEHGRITGDLFIDCTGFRGLLINKALGEPFISFSESLPCDSAIAMQIPSNSRTEGINPYTTATALSSGWAWNIPLFHRLGTGYVYSSSFTSPEAAELEFRAHLGDRSRDCRANHIKMRIGRNRNSWVKNCVAIGLASGFVEPLESTGIFFIQHGIEQLIAHFPGRDRNEAEIRSYNRAVAEVIDGVREFLTLHYAASTRADTPFWKATKTEFSKSPELMERLELWKTRLPTNRTIASGYHGFEAYSYSVMLLGLGHVTGAHPAPLEFKHDTRAFTMFENIRHETKMLLGTLPSQYSYLAERYRQAEKDSSRERVGSELVPQES